MISKSIKCLLFGLFFLSACNSESVEQFSQPYSDSSTIKGLNFDWSTHIRKAPGSDNWPLTWGYDDNQYTTWGDGGGFHGTNRKGRVSLGVAKIYGDINEFKGVNIFGGLAPVRDATIEGKSYGILSIKQDLYMWVSPGSNQQAYQESRLYYSVDQGKSWAEKGWSFGENSGIVNPTFCQYGKGYDDSRDDYVYIYASNVKSKSELEVQRPGEITLMRVHKNRLMELSAYDFFKGIDDQGNARWIKDFEERKPVFFDKNGVGWNMSVSYNKKLDRYFLITEHGESFKGHIGIFDAPNPWGPWTTVYYGVFPSEGNVEKNTFFYNFSNKWLSKDGLDFVLVFTGLKSNDSWNSVLGRFVRKLE